MTSRDVVPAAKGHPSATESPISQRLPGGVRSFVTDHNVARPSHVPTDYINTTKPLPLIGATPLHGAGSARPHTLRPERERGFFSSDDTALTKQILATHAPDIEELNVKPVLYIVEDILRLGKPLSSETSTHGGQVQGHLDTAVDEKKAVLHGSYGPQDEKKAVLHGSYGPQDEKKPVLHGSYGPQDEKKAIRSSYHDEDAVHSLDHDYDIVRLLAFPINKISCEIICKCAAGGEAHSVTMDLLKSLSNYSWDAKVVITFAAFAINYGEFWLVEHLHTKDPLAKNIATLKDLPEIMQHAGELKRKFDSVLDLLNMVVKVTHCLIEFKELPSAYITHESPEMAAATAHIPTAVYWIIRSLLAGASTLLNLIGSGHEYITSTAESWEIASLAHKLSVILEHLHRQLTICKDLIERKKTEDAYIAFKRLMETSHIDNMKVLRAMFRVREDQRPLYDGSRRTNERLEALRSKYVLLLITDLDIPHEELNVLHLIHNQNAMRHEYEVLWLPIVDPATPMTALQNTAFYDLRNNNMPWYSVDHPSLIEPVATRYIREDWKFVHMPMLVVLDPQGRPSNLDALPMMWIWGSNAFPFTKTREAALWAANSWNIELLADSIDPRITEWTRDNKVICLYGGEDMEWIRKFTLSTRAIASALHLPLEMLYVGKRNPKEKVRRCHEVIEREKLSHVFPLAEYYDYVWYFWVRLWSMWNSKKQVGTTVDHDHVMQEIMDLLTYDSSEQGWAVFSRGNYEITKGKGDILLTVLDNYEAWGYKVDRVDRFVPVLDEQIHGTHPEHHCNRLILPGHAGYIPERVVCSECSKPMEKFVMYRCCDD